MRAIAVLCLSALAAAGQAPGEDGYARVFAWAGDWDADGRRDIAVSDGDVRGGVDVINALSGGLVQHLPGPLGCEFFAPEITSIPDADGDGEIDLLLVLELEGALTPDHWTVTLARSSDRVLAGALPIEGAPPLVVGLPPAPSSARARFAVFHGDADTTPSLRVFDVDGCELWRRDLPHGPSLPGVSLTSAPPSRDGEDCRLLLGICARDDDDPWERGAIEWLPNTGVVLIFDAADGRSVGQLAPPVSLETFGSHVVAIPGINDRAGSILVAAHRMVGDAGRAFDAFFQHRGSDLAPLAAWRAPTREGRIGELVRTGSRSPLTWNGERALRGTLDVESDLAWCRLDAGGTAREWAFVSDRARGFGGAVAGAPLDMSSGGWQAGLPDFTNDAGWGADLAGEEWWAPGSAGGLLLVGTWNPNAFPQSALYVVDAPTGHVLARHAR